MNSNKLILTDARQAEELLNNTFFQKHIWQVLNRSVDDKILSCDTANDPSEAQDLIRCRQIISDFETAIKFAIKRGDKIKDEEIRVLNKSKNKPDKEFKR